MSESDVPLDEVTFIIRPTVLDDVGHSMKDCPIYGLPIAKIIDPSNTAHVFGDAC